MKRRAFVPLIFVPALSVADTAKTFIRGRLRQQEGRQSWLELPGGQRVELTGDQPTIGVLNDPRLKDADFEVGGKSTQPGRFEIDQIHTRSMFAYKDGQRLMVTYWCDVCYIRTYTPGNCWCCQEWTALDLRDPNAPERTP